MPSKATGLLQTDAKHQAPFQLWQMLKCWVDCLREKQLQKHISRWVKLTVFNLLRFTPEKDLALVGRNIRPVVSYYISAFSEDIWRAHIYD